jgi:hypothetical protein
MWKATAGELLINNWRVRLGAVAGAARSGFFFVYLLIKKRKLISREIFMKLRILKHLPSAICWYQL